MMDFIHYDEHLEAIGWLEHEPVRKPRDGWIGENIFVQQWRTLMRSHLDEFGRDCQWGSPNSRLAAILSTHPEPLTQRHATVAASLICWLGTNGGAGFIHEARREQERWSLNAPWLRAWAVENQRRNGSNGSYRIAEHLLQSEKDNAAWNQTSMFSTQRVLLPQLSASDYEVLELVVCWLGCERGNQFVKNCEWLIEQEQKKARRIQRAVDLAKMRGVEWLWAP